MPTPVLRSHISEYSASAALFQCQHSTHQDGQVFTPNIPDLYFDPASFKGMKNSVSKSRNGFTYIFTIPPESAERNCSGTVVAIQYCYWVHKDNIGSIHDVFSFHSVTRDGFAFAVTDSFTVRTTQHQESDCRKIMGKDYLCCDTTTLGADNQLSISTDNYTFGVTIVNDQVKPYALNLAKFEVEHFQLALGANGQLQAGMEFDAEQAAVIGGLLLMRLFIGKLCENAGIMEMLYVIHHQQNLP